MRYARPFLFAFVVLALMDLAAAQVRQIALQSTSFGANSAIPPRYTGDGENLSPGLDWTGVPFEAKELVIICDDPDAPTDKPWVHWIAYKIPPHLTSLPIGAGQKIDGKILHGKNSWGTEGYRGPAPPPGRVHHYRFQIYALDKQLIVERSLTRQRIDALMAGNVIAVGELIGTYEAK